MVRYPVCSTTVKFVGYDPAARFMQIEFCTGQKIYDFADVPPEEVANLMFAESIGSHFARHIRGKYVAPPLPSDPCPKTADGLHTFNGSGRCEYCGTQREVAV